MKLMLGHFKAMFPWCSLRTERPYEPYLALQRAGRNRDAHGRDWSCLPVVNCPHQVISAAWVGRAGAEGVKQT